jgi:hypothetical protein
MKIKIIKIEHGAEFDGIVWDYWIDAVLPNNLSVKLFDFNGFDLTSFEGGFIDANVKALFVEKNKNDDLFRFDGKIVKKEDRYFLVDEFGTNIELKSDDVENNSFQINQNSIFFLGRLDFESIND